MRARVEASEVPVEGGLARAVAGLVVDDERRVDRHQAVLGDVRREGGRDRVVVGLRREVHQVPGVVECGDPGGLDLTPCEIDADEVHGAHPVMRAEPFGAMVGASCCASACSFAAAARFTDPDPSLRSSVLAGTTSTTARAS
jgi:hypothetical protein